MTDNHTHDQQLLHQVERVLTEGQPSGDALLDGLVATQPQPSATFQRQLEEQLMLALSDHSYDPQEEMMTQKTPKRRWLARLPLTLAAVIGITLMGGSALLLMNNMGGSPLGFAAQAETQPVPTLDPLFMSATAFIKAATESANPVDPLAQTATAIFEQMRVDPMDLTGTAIIDEATARAAGVDPMSLTATAILEQATARAAGVDPMSLTATAFINEATARAAGLGSVPVDPAAATATAMIAEATQYAATYFMEQTAEHRGTSEPEPVMATVTALIADATATAEAARLTQEGVADFQPILIARDTIRRGTQLTADMLTTIYVPPDLDFHVLQADRTDMAGDVVSVFDGGADQAAGQYAMVDIPALSPLLANDLVAENPIGTLPRGLSYPMTIHVPAEMAQSLTPGDRAQIITDLSALLTGFSADEPRLLTLVDLVEVLEILPAEAGRAAVSVTMASNNDRQLVMDLLARGVPLTLANPDYMIPAISDNMLMPQDEAALGETLPDGQVRIILPDGKVGVAVAVNSAPTADFQIGDRVNVVASILFINVDEEYQAGFDSQQPPQLVTQTIVEDAEVLQITPGMVTLAVSPQDGTILTFAAEANYPLTLVNIPAISDQELTPTAEAALAETRPLAADGWQMALDENTRIVEVFIPLVDAPDNLVIGDRVGISAEMQFRETDNQARIEIMPPAPQSSYRFYRIVAQPQLLSVEADGLVVSMSQLEAVELSHALDTGLPLSLASRSDTESPEFSFSETLAPAADTQPIPFMTYYEPVIVALNYIAEGDLLNGDQINASTAFWLVKPQGALETLPYQARASRWIQAGEVLFADDINGEPAPTAQPGTIPHGWVGVSVVSSLNLITGIQSGDRGSLFAEIVSEQGQIIERMVIADAVVIRWPNTNAESDVLSGAYMIAVIPRDAILLNWLVEAEIPLTFHAAE